MPAPKHSKAATKAHPAPKRTAFKTGDEYAEACRLVSEARVEFDKPKLTTAQRLDIIGIDVICSRISEGEDDGTIAASLGMARTQLRDWIQSREHDKKVSSARENSAEAWLDKGYSVLQSALSKESGIDGGVAKSIAQECARRAAIRNHKYRDKVAHGGDDEAPPIRMDVTITPEEAYRRLVNG